jgi:hypothetical protein
MLFLTPSVQPSTAGKTAKRPCIFRDFDNQPPDRFSFVRFLWRSKENELARTGRKKREPKTIAVTNRS